LIGRIAQFWSPTGFHTILSNFWREGWFPSRIVQLLEGVAQPTARPSLKKQLMRGCNKLPCTGWQSARKPLKLLYLKMQDMLLRMVGREAPKRN